MEDVQGLLDVSIISPSALFRVIPRSGPQDEKIAYLPSHKTGFARIPLLKWVSLEYHPQPNTINLIQYHFHHFRLIENMLLFLKFYCAETARSFLFFLSILSLVILVRVFLLLTERLPMRKHVFAGVEQQAMLPGTGWIIH